MVIKRGPSRNAAVAANYNRTNTPDITRKNEPENSEHKNFIRNGQILGVTGVLVLGNNKPTRRCNKICRYDSQTKCSRNRVTKNANEILMTIDTRENLTRRMHYQF